MGGRSIGYALLSVMGSKTPEDHYRRLSEAVDLYLGHRADRSPSGDNAGVESMDELLAQNPELHDLLRPMLDAKPEQPGEVAAESPRFFGDYELLREVGRGGMGVVYEAIEVALQRRVALKLLPNYHGSSASRIERFRREAAAAGRLQHPGIATVHRVGEHNDSHFIAMELVDGPNLAMVLERLRQEAGDGAYQVRLASLDVGEGVDVGNGGYYASVAELVARVAEALAYAHDHGVVHRDVKPHNILLGGRSGVKLVDFGLAKDFDREAVTRTGETAGTPDYMSPEQVRGEAVDRRSDVYSLGVVLYELLTWCRPFESGSVHATLAAIVSREAAAVRRMQPQTPRDLGTICDKAMEKDPARRYPSAAALAEDLRRFRRHEPILATPPTAASRAVKLVRRNRAISIAAVFALLALVVAPVSFAVYFKKSRDRLGVEQLETARQRDLAAAILVEARNSLDDVYTWLAQDRLAVEPGMARVRRELLSRALVFYERFCELAADEPSLRMDTALARFRLGRLLFDLRQRERAMTFLLEALAAMDTLEPPPGRELELALEHARAVTFMISATMNRSQIRASEGYETRALKLLASLPESHDQQWCIKYHQIATVHSVRSERLVQYGKDPEAALQAVGQAIDLWQAIVDRKVATDAMRASFASALSSRSVLEGRRGRFEAGFDDGERALASLKVVAENQELSLMSRRMTVRILQKQSELLMRSGQSDRAVEVARRAVAEAKTLHEQYSGYHSMEYLHASASYDLANALLRSGDAEAACKQLEHVWGLACKLFDKAPAMLAASTLVGNVASPLAALRRQLHGAEAVETLPLHERAVRVFETAFENHPKSATLQTMLAKALSAYGNELCHADQLERAQAVLARAVELSLRAVRVHPRDKDRRFNARVAFVRQIATDRDLGQLQSAHAAAVRFVAELSDGETHYQAAREMARLGVAADANTQYVAQSGAWREQALEWLREAIAIDGSLWSDAVTDSAFAELVETEKFRRLDPGR